jgi:hypothetical protein
VLQYLASLPPLGDTHLDQLRKKLARLPQPVVTKADWQRLEAIEQAEAERRGLPEFKYGSNEEMLAAMELTRAQAEPAAD